MAGPSWMPDSSAWFLVPPYKRQAVVIAAPSPRVPIAHLRIERLTSSTTSILLIVTGLRKHVGDPSGNPTPFAFVTILCFLLAKQFQVLFLPANPQQPRDKTQEHTDRTTVIPKTTHPTIAEVDLKSKCSLGSNTKQQPSPQFAG